MKSRSSSLMLPTRAPRKDFADTHNIFATLPTRDPQYGFPHFVNQAVAKNKEANQYQDDGWGIGAYMHPRAYFLIVACNIINKKSGWLYFHASCCRLQNRCLSRSTCIGGLSLPSSHALRFNQGAERKKNSMLSCSTGANRQFMPSLVFIVIGARRSPSRFPVDAVGILSGTTPGCEAAHSAFTGTKSAASLFAIGAVLAFVSEPLLAQVDSELMVSSLELGVLLLDFSLPTRGVDLVVHDERHCIESQKANKKLQAIWDPTFDRDEGVVFTRNPRVPDQVK
ncbi:hypothetical protein V6N11_030980 [Hibiscus sabdariffa]|uniref:Uncharacterized protein n=1 Tax=Hibiscus sabdariffa TaxID=183260 RepID=A0ABR2NS03_9ROSI